MTTAEPIGTVDRSLSEQTYEYLRTAIIEGTIVPGTWLRERELAEQLNVSRIPIRGALPMLERDGFIRVEPRRGAVVRQLSLHEVEELFDIRERLEVLATEAAARRAKTTRPTLLEEALSREQAAGVRGDHAEIAASGAGFHEAMIEFSGHSLLQTMMKPIIGRVQWVFRLTSFRDPHVQHQEHEQILDAIRQGDDRLAGALAYVHIARGREPSFRALREILPPDSLDEVAMAPVPPTGE